MHPLPSFGRLCYNGAAVKQALQWGVKPASASEEVEEPISSDRVGPEPSGTSIAGTVTAGMSGQSPGHEDASRFCPVCSKRLESRRCKLVCNVCGYYMSCADYY
jgi:hypothetical protein